MNRAPTLRPLHLINPEDAAREAARSGVSAGELTEFATRTAQSPGRPYAWTDLDADWAARLAAAADRFDLRTLPAPSAGRLYMAASAPELARLRAALDDPGFAPIGTLVDGAPAALVTKRRVLRYGSRPLLMGVLNVTPDSFSDGGRYADPARAISRAWEIAEQGADLIDVGGESTRPGAEPLAESEELNRVLPVIEGLADRFPLPISIDTYKGGVARRAFEAGADLVNDITGLDADPEIARAAAEHGAPLVLSHIRGTPRSMQESPTYADIMAEVASDLLASARLAMREGVPRTALLIDPGIGFGKSLDHNLELIRRLPEIAGLGFPLLIGVSRKSFIGRILDRPPDARLEGSLAAAEAARLGGAAIVRVHDVAETARFFAVLGAIGAWAETEKGRR